MQHYSESICSHQLWLQDTGFIHLRQQHEALRSPPAMHKAEGCLWTTPSSLQADAEELERQEAKAPGHLIVSFPSRLNGKSCFTKDEMRGFPFSRVQVHPFNKHSLTCSTSCPESKEMRLHVGFSRGAHTTTSSASTAAASAATAHEASETQACSGELHPRRTHVQPQPPLLQPVPSLSLHLSNGRLATAGHRKASIMLRHQATSL